MATGHTYPVIDGEITTAQEFAFECARSFVWSFREGDKLAYPKVDDYYRKSLAESIAKLDDWDNLDEEGRYAKWSDYAIAQEQRAEESKKKADENYERLMKVFKEVQAIKVPETHANFKQFMLDQLNDTIQWDGTYKPEHYRVVGYVEWVEAQRGYLARSVEHDAERIREVEETNAKSRKWISKLAGLYGLEVKERDE